VPAAEQTAHPQQRSAQAARESRSSCERDHTRVRH